MAISVIRNKHSLLKTFNRSQSSKYAIYAAESALDEVDPAKLIARSIRQKNNRLIISDIKKAMTTIDLMKHNKIYVIGAGKAAVPLTASLMEVLQNWRPRGSKPSGSINTPYGTFTKIDGVDVFEAGHPLPDMNSVKGTRHIIDILMRTKESDLVFVLLSGGGSSLLALPVKGITLDDKRFVTEALLSAGAPIHELNIVRKHLSDVKAGKLIRYGSPGTTFVTLSISDVIGDDIQTIASGPTCPDNSSFVDAKNVLTKHEIWDKQNSHLKRVRKVIMDGMKGRTGDSQNPREAGKRAEYAIIGNNSMACYAAARYLRSKKFETLVLGSHFSGDAAEFGRWLSQMANEMKHVSLPFAMVLGGETTVRLDKNKSVGIGGRNQEAALSALISLHASPREDISICCIGTDGVDGTSQAAGALVSGTLPNIGKRISKANLRKYLDRHDSSSAFRILHSQVMTGKTLTNVNDITIICRSKKYSLRP
jgi:glycerate 2-kinase